MDKYIKTILDRYEYPIINSFTFSNGEMLVLKSYFIGRRHKIRVLCKSTIESYFDYNKKDYVSSFAVPICVENEKFRVFAGEGSWGGDGIVYVIDKFNNEPIWFLFLDNSNPFKEVQFEEPDILIVQSTLDIKLRIPIKKANEIESL